MTIGTLPIRSEQIAASSSGNAEGLECMPGTNLLKSGVTTGNIQVVWHDQHVIVRVTI
jgi:predicted carbohydrate-binding protein with CBM5 and CBM33 domain